jgi:hypothetical protein
MFGYLMVLLGFTIFDVASYARAPSPQRRKWYFKLPGGGIVAWLIFGDRKDCR